MVTLKALLISWAYPLIIIISLYKIILINKANIYKNIINVFDNRNVIGDMDDIVVW